MAAGEFLAKPFDPPRRDDLDRRVERLGGKLEAALIVAFAGRAVCIGVGPHVAGDLQTDLADQRPCDRRTHQVDRLVLRAPHQHGKREVAAQLLLGIDDTGRLRAALPGLGHHRIAVLARLAEIDVDGVDVVPFVLEPAEDDRGIKTAGVSENATGHGEY